MGDVGSARYEPALLPPCPTIRVLSNSNCQRSTHLILQELKLTYNKGEGPYTVVNSFNFYRGCLCIYVCLFITLSAAKPSNLTNKYIHSALVWLPPYLAWLMSVWLLNGMIARRKQSQECATASSETYQPHPQDKEEMVSIGRWFGSMVSRVSFFSIKNMLLSVCSMIDKPLKCLSQQLMHWDTFKQDVYSTVGGDGGCRVGEVRAGTTSPIPDHKGFKLQ